MARLISYDRNTGRMHEIKFHTSMDCPTPGSWVFPEEVVDIPKVGDYVRVNRGKIVLKVDRITHSMSDCRSPLYPVYEVELVPCGLY